MNDGSRRTCPQDVDLFTSEHNAPITWDHLLRQTSDWYGELWGKPDWADRPSENGATPAEWPKRPKRAPGTFYKYNDVRVNVLSLATLYVMKRPLPVVLKESIMDPIGASDTWHWEPYDNAYVTINGRRMPSVPGGGHHGGGMFINAWDMARFGYLFLRNGKWNGKQLDFGEVDRDGAHAGHGHQCRQQDLRLHELVPERARRLPARTRADAGAQDVPAAPESAVAVQRQRRAT